jgi:hypothetical protein
VAWQRWQTGGEYTRAIALKNITTKVNPSSPSLACAWQQLPGHVTGGVHTSPCFVQQLDLVAFLVWLQVIIVEYQISPTKVFSMGFPEPIRIYPGMTHNLQVGHPGQRMHPAVPNSGRCSPTTVSHLSLSSMTHHCSCCECVLSMWAPNLAANSCSRRCPGTPPPSHPSTHMAHVRSTTCRCGACMRPQVVFRPLEAQEYQDYVTLFVDGQQLVIPLRATLPTSRLQVCLAAAAQPPACATRCSSWPHEHRLQGYVL